MSEQANDSFTMRLPKSMSAELTRLAQEKKRSRASVLKEVFADYLASSKIKMAPKPFNFEQVMKLAGSGVRPGKERTMEEIVADIRWLRGDD